ncbi:MAG TPA: ferritin-like domain-containing protein [Bryobacteraceae bacterium]
MTNTPEKKTTSRRNWFAGSAAILGAGAVASIVARAQSSGGGSNTTNDINLLNFALRLENLESNFYSQALAMFAPKDFQSSTTLQALGGTKIGANIYGYIQAIGQNEADHVAKLTQTIVAMGGTPQPVDCYNFGFKNVDQFLQIAQTLENAGVSAYDGAIASLSDPNLQTAAATIATVEARHAALLNMLNFSLPFPTAFDTTQTSAQVLAIAGQYLTTGCTPTPTQLTYAQAGPTKHAIITTNQTTVKLDASKSTAANGQPLTFLWNQDLGSPLAAITNDTYPQATAILLGGPGEYSIALKVTDTAGNSDQDDIKIIYQP